MMSPLDGTLHYSGTLAAGIVAGESHLVVESLLPREALMGQASRNQNSNKNFLRDRLTSAPWCDVCGCELDTDNATVEHLPPKVLFTPKDRSAVEFIRTISCVRCNHASKQCDQYIAWLALSGWAAHSRSRSVIEHVLKVQKGIRNNDVEAFQKLEFKPFGDVPYSNSRNVGLDSEEFDKRVRPFQAKITAAYFSNLLASWALKDRVITMQHQLAPHHFDFEAMVSMLSELPDGISVTERNGVEHLGFSARWDINREDRIGVFCFSLYRIVHLLSFVVPNYVLELDPFDDGYATVSPETGIVIRKFHV